MMISLEIGSTHVLTQNDPSIFFLLKFLFVTTGENKIS